MTNSYKLSYEELLDLTNKISPYQWCLNSLLTEVNKWLNGLSPDIHLQFQSTGTIVENIIFLWLIIPKLMDMVEIQFHIKLIKYGIYYPVKEKNSTNLNSFKLKIKQWCCPERPCTLCKTYLPNPGYL